MSINVSAIKAFLVSNTDGSINYDDSVAKFQMALQEFEELNSQGDEKIASACSEVFDQYPGLNVTQFPAFVIAKLGVSPSNYGETMSRIQAYLKANTGEYGEALFGMRKGIGGGHWRWSDKLANDETVTKSLLAIKKRKLAAALASDE